MFNVRNISKEFQEDFWKEPFKALDDFSFELPEGVITGFLGANGAGKTTFLKILLKFIKPTSGDIQYKNFEDKKIFKDIGYMPERPYYYEHLTGREFLTYCGKLQDLSDEELEKAISLWTKELKVDFALDRYLKSYSKGMLQRVGFASALLHNPKLVILDEPLSGLDPIGRKEFKDILVKLNKEYGCTVFFSSHIVSDVEEVCENVVVIEKGRLVYQGKISDLLTQASKKLLKIEVEGLGIDFLEVEELIEKQSESTLNTNVFCKRENLNNLISYVISKDKKLLSVTHENYSLEEVVYKLNE